MTFWMIYVADKMYAVHCGFASALPSEYDQREAIETVFPREMEDYEFVSPSMLMSIHLRWLTAFSTQGTVSDAESDTLKDFVDMTQGSAISMGRLRRQDTPYTLILKALTVLEMGVRVKSRACASAFFVTISQDYGLIMFPTDAGIPNLVLAMAQLETAAGRLLSLLPAASAIISPIDTSPPADILAPPAHVVVLSALTEVYHILGDVDPQRGAEGRLASADRLSQLAQRFSELDLSPCHGVSGVHRLGLLWISLMLSRCSIDGVLPSSYWSSMLSRARSVSLLRMTMKYILRR